MRPNNAARGCRAVHADGSGQRVVDETSPADRQDDGCRPRPVRGPRWSVAHRQQIVKMMVAVLGLFAVLAGPWHVAVAPTLAKPRTRPEFGCEVEVEIKAPASRSVWSQSVMQERQFLQDQDQVRRTTFSGSNLQNILQ